MKPNLTSNLFLTKLVKKNNLIYQENKVIHNTLFFNFIYFTFLLLILLFLLYLYLDKQTRMKIKKKLHMKSKNIKKKP